MGFLSLVMNADELALDRGVRDQRGQQASGGKRYESVDTCSVYWR
jgi:hypothetical protein